MEPEILAIIELSTTPWPAIALLMVAALAVGVGITSLVMTWPQDTEMDR